MQLLVLVSVASLAVATACGPSRGGDGVVRSGSSSGDVDTLYANDADQIPCAPRMVLENVCQQCHTRPAKSGAPFPLQGRSDVLRTYDGEVIRVLMIEQIDAKRMPLTPVTMTDEDRTTLTTWLRAGAPAAPAQSCLPDGGTTSTSTGAPPDDAGTDGAGAPADDGDAGDTDSGL